MGQHLLCTARENAPCCCLSNRQTPLPRFGDRRPDEGQRNAEVQCIDCVQIVQTVRNGIRAFNASGLAALSAGSSRPKSAAPALDGAVLEQLRAILHNSPRAFGHAQSTWTLGLLERVAHEQGLSAAVLSPETIRQALLRLGIRWRRAKCWLTSSDPAYARKKPVRPLDRHGAALAGLDAWVRRRGLVLPLGPTQPACLGAGGRTVAS
jgi:transposase